MFDLAFSSKDLYVPKSKDGRWIASLSDGSTVFENKVPHKISAWRRLKQYLEFHNLQITNLRLEAYDRSISLISYKDKDGNPQVSGYWQAGSVGAFCNLSAPEIRFRGIGYIKDKIIHICWIRDDSVISVETRSVILDNGQIDAGVILNDPI